MKSNSNDRPPILQDLGNGSWHYNYNITEVEIQSEPMAETEEFSLINKYNAFVLGLSTDETDKTEYEAYLSEVIAVKAMVRADLQEAGIEVTGSKL